MLTTYQRVLDEYRRRIRLEATLSTRESDRRDQAKVLTWTRYQKESHQAQPAQAHSIHRRVCAWCRTCYGLAIWPQSTAPMDTHGGCERCIREWKETYLRRNK